ncbi:MAG: regulatory protein RecX, partial [Clostridia bacterium]|nr:regulatory protein RecX [Clostridia bacterium]
DKDVAALKSIREETVLSDEQLSEIIELSDYTRAKSRALWYLDRSDHTEKQLYDKLIRARFSPRVCAKVIAKLKELGLIDDERFAKRYSERLFEANTSKRQILCKLYEKGVSRDLAKVTVCALPEDETALIRNLIEKKYKQKLKDKESVKKVYAALIRKGFSFSGVKEVLKDYEEELAYTFEDT